MNRLTNTLRSRFDRFRSKLGPFQVSTAEGYVSHSDGLGPFLGRQAKENWNARIERRVPHDFSRDAFIKPGASASASSEGFAASDATTRVG